MFKLILQGLIVLVLSVALGGVSIYIYNTIVATNKVVPNDRGGLTLKRSGVVDEVYDDSGVLMDQLAYSFDDSGEREAAVEKIGEAGIKAKIVGERIMIESGSAGNALDILLLTGLVPSDNNFSFAEVTADPDSVDYIIQQRLASQNMLARMIETMSASINKVHVLLNAKKVVGEIDSVTVSILRAEGVQGLNISDIEDIKQSVAAFVALDDPEVVDIVDVQTGNSY